MMKKLTLLLLLLACFQMQSQTVLGKWKTIDDKTGETKSIVEVYENNGKVYGKVIEIFDATKRNRKCEKCEGTDKNKPVLGLVIIKGLTKDDDEHNGGKILDPETGNLYKCILKISGKDKLEVRGYMGFALIGRSQTWVRVK
ncbi:Uncharacterized conserved protein, DUF2147 family [Flavobacterium swingsii]|jgi:uncharacterized protein (DUF2147 family)|uniref:Uncharacterized conserved protein, DUF2147 family n=2 Tax=Flavobacterium swingsii TaxID=498292 RepID=A0A1I0WJE3_9FLAO|nr:Uncharacterized conserved protein, DUF2147 family [Flavobacterium swingsii]